MAREAAEFGDIDAGIVEVASLASGGGLLQDISSSLRNVERVSPVKGNTSLADQNSTHDASPGDMAKNLASSRSGEKGVLVPLKTTLETKAKDRAVEVYVTAVSPRQASNTLNFTRSLIPDEGGLDLQHLRRFAKYADVPASVRAAYQKELAKHEKQVFDDAETSNNLFLVVGSVNSVSRTVVLDALLAVDEKAVVFTIKVPLLASTSTEQAKRLSEKYWPTVYKKSNPFGPHPSIVSRAGEEIVGEVGEWMELAERVAREAEERGIGEGVGCVVVERREGRGRAVAVAGDARWDGKMWRRDRENGGKGNVTAHAVMRGIAMVATGLRAEGAAKEALQNKENPTHISALEKTEPSSKPANKNPTGSHPHQNKNDPPSPAAKASIFCDTPLFPLEAQHLHPSGDGDGYLCHNLEIYCTHEPCVMCSMAIVHSRFGKVVFGKRMPEIGGFCADFGAGGEGLGHGLFWRKELNWNMLAWEWRGEGEVDDGEDGEVEGGFLHA